MTVDDKTIERIVQRVTQELASAHRMEYTCAEGCNGIKFLYDDVNEAVEAAYKAQREFLKFKIEDRKRITDKIKSV